MRTENGVVMDGVTPKFWDRLDQKLNMIAKLVGIPEIFTCPRCKNDFHWWEGVALKVGFSKTYTYRCKECDRKILEEREAAREKAKKKKEEKEKAESLAGIPEEKRDENWSGDPPIRDQVMK